jgi:hypothetical protein
MTLHLGPPQAPGDTLPTDELVKSVSKGADDLGLQELYFQFARYLLISSSRLDGQTDLKLALAYAMVFNEMLRDTDFLRMTAFTMGVSTLDYNQTAATLNTNGLLFKLYGELPGAGSIPVALTGNSRQPAPMQHIVGDLPWTSAGSPTYPLDMVAALSADHKFLTLAVVNATDSEQKFSVEGQRHTPDRHRNNLADDKQRTRGCQPRRPVAAGSK